MCGWGAAKWGRQEEQVGATGPLLKGGSGRVRVKYTVRFPILERGYTPENRPVELL